MTGEGNNDLLHGGALDRVAARFRNAPTPWVDLSTGINPWPWPVEHVDTVELHRLPTAEDMNRCAAAMAGAFGTSPSNIVLVPGTEIAIRLLPSVLPARRVAILSPSYGDHAAAWNTAGANVMATDDPLGAGDGVSAVVVCNPNNPDGRTFRTDELLAARDRLAARGGVLIVDEAYADLNPAQSVAPHAGLPGLVVLRSTGKFFGLPGLRLGAVLAPPAIRSALETLLGVWRVTGPALSIGAKAYADRDWQHETRRRLASARADLDEALGARGVRIAGGTDLFRFIETADAHALWTELCKRGVYTRRFRWSRTHLRIGLPDGDAARARLVEAFALEH